MSGAYAPVQSSRFNALEARFKVQCSRFNEGRVQKRFQTFQSFNSIVITVRLALLPEVD